jgi:hypothetical protein
MESVAGGAVDTRGKQAFLRLTHWSELQAARIPGNEDAA